MAGGLGQIFAKMNIENNVLHIKCGFGHFSGVKRDIINEDWCEIR